MAEGLSVPGRLPQWGQNKEDRRRLDHRGHDQRQIASIGRFRLALEGKGACSTAIGSPERSCLVLGKPEV